MANFTYLYSLSFDQNHMSFFLYSLLAFLIGVCYPGYGLLTAAKAKAFLLQHPNQKALAYLGTIFLQAFLSIVILSAMYVFGDAWEIVGLAWLNIGIAPLALVLIGLLFWYLLFQIPLSPKSIPRLQNYYAPLFFLMPNNWTDYKVSIALAYTAGTCEELLFRGFLFWQIALYLPLVPAVVLANFLFAIGHLITGQRNTLLAFLFGLALSSIYLWTGSLCWPMLIHILVDIYSLTIWYKLLQRTDSPDSIEL